MIRATHKRAINIRHHLLILAISLALLSLTAAESIAQDAIPEPFSEIEQLRNDLRKANETIQKIETRLRELEQEGASTPPSTPNEVIRLAEEASPDEFLEKTAPSLILGTPTLTLDTLDAFDSARSRSIVSEGAVLDNALSQSARSTRNQSSISVGLLGGTSSGRASVTLSRSKLNSDCLLETGVSLPRNNEPDSCRDATATSYTRDTTTLALSTPVSDDGDTSFATIDGLANGTRAELRWTRFWGSIPKAEILFNDENIQKARAECERLNPTNKITCVTINRTLLERYLSVDDRESFRRNVFDNSLRNKIALSVSGSVSHQDFTVFDDPSLARSTEDRFSVSAGAGLLYFPSYRTSLLFESEFQRSFDAADSMTRCESMLAEEESLLNCATGAFELPEAEESIILATQLRRYFPVSSSGFIRDIAIAPRLEFDALSDDFAIDVPIYLVASQSNGLVAGIRVGYEDENDDGDFRFGIFYGQSFSLNPF